MRWREKHDLTDILNESLWLLMENGTKFGKVGLRLGRKFLKQSKTQKRVEQTRVLPTET